MHLDSRWSTWITSICDDADRLANCITTGDLSSPVAACPGWDVRDLVVHLGGVHRWATGAILGGVPPTGNGDPAPDVGEGTDALAEWLRSGAAGVVDALSSTAMDAETWHPFPFEQRVWVWARRQAQETMLHRWDGEHATTGSSTLDPARAAEGIHEFLELGWPRVFAREQVTPPASSLHLHCTDDDLDGAGEWLVWSDGGEYRMEPVHRTGDAALRGSAADLLLVLMGRADVDRLDVVGEPSAASAWLELPGL